MIGPKTWIVKTAAAAEIQLPKPQLPLPQRHHPQSPPPLPLPPPSPPSPLPLSAAAAADPRWFAAQQMWRSRNKDPPSAAHILKIHYGMRSGLLGGFTVLSYYRFLVVV